MPHAPEGATGIQKKKVKLEDNVSENGSVAILA
jgi:hypothetical protein